MFYEQFEWLLWPQAKNLFLLLSSDSWCLCLQNPYLRHAVDMVVLVFHLCNLLSQCSHLLWGKENTHKERKYKERRWLYFIWRRIIMQRDVKSVWGQQLYLLQFRSVALQTSSTAFILGLLFIIFRTYLLLGRNPKCHMQYNTNMAYNVQTKTWSSVWAF